MDAFLIAEEAGTRTADHIIANRIPQPAVWLLQHLPAMFAAPLLMAAIGKHAWTFIGAGAFAAQGAWAFTIDRTAANDPVSPPGSLFHWYAPVFMQLYRQLTANDCFCTVVYAPQGRPLSVLYNITRQQNRAPE